MEQIAKAIINVMKEVRGMEKNSQVGSGRMAYNGTKDQDVKEVFNKALAENGLCILPTGIEEETQVDRWEEDDTYNKKPPYPKKTKQSIFTKVKTKYLLLHESGESIELAGYGQGVDTQDKGAGKATTYALKNALLYAFLTPVGKIDDTDTTHSNDMQQPQYNNYQEQPPKQEQPLTKEEKDAIELKESIKAYQINIGELLTTQESLGLNGVAIKNSIKHHLKTETLSQCKDISSLSKYYLHCQNKITELKKGV